MLPKFLALKKRLPSKLTVLTIWNCGGLWMGTIQTCPAMVEMQRQLSMKRTHGRRAVMGRLLLLLGMII